MRPLPLDQVYRFIEPGPVVLLSTAQDGHANVMTMSWHMMMEFTPPLIACIVSEGDFSFRALKATGECVIAIPAVGLAEKVVAAGNASGRDGDKFARVGLTPAPASKVGAPLVKECFANLECRVVDTALVPAYNLFVLEVVAAWSDPAQEAPKTLHHRGYGTFAVDGEIITLDSRMP
ncbi:flavin reductase family protein [Ancylobacter sp. TS-1]|uniref:flavin reductase family protein n=1 Tax=Ancylobacter sp. TS-1 TaxID=1850374 RepID=UPI001265ADF2|nr:flavin reductase family protein [Ancylobacter sp. TS-1]QFR33407.1 flavin reductase family protein [Ancylobacter sp. TS-1]